MGRVSTAQFPENDSGELKTEAVRLWMKQQGGMVVANLAGAHTNTKPPWKVLTQKIWP